MRMYAFFYLSFIFKFNLKSPSNTRSRLERSKPEMNVIYLPGTGPADACVQLIDYWNNTYFVNMERFPEVVFTEV